MSLYLYCLLDDDFIVENVIFSGPREGISGSLVTLFIPEDFALLVSDFAGTSVPVTRENVLLHAAVVNAVLPETTPLPFRFGTLTTKAALDSFLAARSQALRAKFELVRGCVEMNVKIIWNREWIEEKSAVEMKPGTAFLTEKRRQIFGSEARVTEATKIAAWLEERLSNSIRETRVNTNTTDKLLVTAAHLVERGSIDEYRSRLKNAQLERPELHFLASGPWPPYSFANIDLEFKTQFGVS
ncbi:MAG TPA: GvpL/GvpF family gas vesicle protein [Pyrinomonadaceae bacterium]|nr:GvpL/GvpF family gas vesicle protein [Pyrinomonadaceae bacterium]